MSWTNKIRFFAAFLFLLTQGLLIWSIPLSGPYAAFFYFYEVALIFAFFVSLQGVLLIVSNSLILLLLVNLIWAPLDGSLKTLQPNFHKKVAVVGDVMPGFEGVNTISTDHLGFRHSNNVNYDNSDSFRVFTIGGSTTEEIYVDDKETWSALLQNHLYDAGLKHAEVINTGVSGIRAEHHFETQRYVSKMYPDLLIFLVGANNWNRQIKTVLSPQKIIPRNNDSGWFPKLHSSLLFLAVRNLKKFILTRYLFNGDEMKVKNDQGDYYRLQNDSLNRSIKVSMKLESVDELYKKFMSMIVEDCKKSSYKCMLMTQPSAYQENISPELKKRLWMTPPNEDYTLYLNSLINISTLYNEWLLEFEKSEGIPVCDLSKEIKPSTKYFYDDVHFNEKGSVKVAAVVAGCVKSSFPNFFKIQE